MELLILRDPPRADGQSDELVSARLLLQVAGEAEASASSRTALAVACSWAISAAIEFSDSLAARSWKGRWDGGKCRESKVCCCMTGGVKR